jgi:pimeloyl-ACP methyl ester carboxylesterase
MQQFITVGNHRLGYETFGNPQNPVIIFVHGYLSGRNVWRTTIPALQSEYFCVAVELLGHGASDKPHAADYSILAQAHRVLAIADHLGIYRFSLVGHSMGAQICMAITGEVAPERVELLVNIAGIASARLNQRLERTAGYLVKRKQVVRWLIKIPSFWVQTRIRAQVAFGAFRNQIESLPVRVTKRKSVVGRVENMISEAWDAIYGYNASVILPNIQVPTLIIFGKRDGVVPLSDAYLAHQLIVGSRLVLLNDGAHFPMYETSKPYLYALKTFLSETKDLKKGV